MKTTTAKTPADVRKWIEENEHHNAAVLTKQKRQLQSKHDQMGYFYLSGHFARLYVPTEIHKQCFLTPYNAPQGRMYRWDDIAEKTAPDFGKYITTDVNTFELDAENGIAAEPCGIRQGVLTEIDYYTPDKSVQLEPYYVVHGEKGWYAMKVGGTYAIVEDKNLLLPSTREHVRQVREKFNFNPEGVVE